MGYLRLSRLNFSLLFLDASGKVKIWHVTTGQSLRRIEETRQTICSSLHPDGQHYATGGAGNHINVYDTETGERVICYEPR